MHEKESYEQLQQRIKGAMHQVIVGGYYLHYKQRKYKVVTVALREEDNEPCVVYEAEYMPGVTWIRPLANWLEEVEVDGKRVKRFTKVEP